jgi:hypothetical protein
MVTMRNLVFVSTILSTKIGVLATVMWKIGYRIFVVISTTTSAASVAAALSCFYYLTI